MGVGDADEIGVAVRMGVEVISGFEGLCGKLRTYQAPADIATVRIRSETNKTDPILPRADLEEGDFKLYPHSLFHDFCF